MSNEKSLNETMDNSKKMSRRGFLKMSATAGVGAALLGGGGVGAGVKGDHVILLC